MFARSLYSKIRIFEAFLFEGPESIELEYESGDSSYGDKPRSRSPDDIASCLSRDYAAPKPAFILRYDPDEDEVRFVRATEGGTDSHAKTVPKPDR
jgi:hypothetical protein